MASPCEVLIDGGESQRVSRKNAAKITRAVSDEAWRIEQHWSRYREDSVIQRINLAMGRPVKVDEETAKMLDYAATLQQLSGGKFDVTSGVLRRAWKFDGSDKIPSQAHISQLNSLIGWSRVVWNNPVISLQPEMQLDFGGIGKEYAVDRALQKAIAVDDVPILINFGGDLACNKPRWSGAAWQVGIDAGDGAAKATVAVKQGGIATSGDASRYLLSGGKRYSHVLNALTGWPVENAPASVTVAAPNCTLAGMVATLAMLQGEGAEAFLEQQQGIRFRIYRH